MLKELNIIQDRSLHRTETDVLPLNRLRLGIRQDPVLNTERIKGKTSSHCSMAKRTYKELKHKITIEISNIFNGDIFPQSLRKDLIKVLHDDIHGDILAKQMRLKLQAWWLSYSGDAENYVTTCRKCTEVKKFRQTNT